MTIQAGCYPPSMQEAQDIVLSRILVAGDTSLVAVDGQQVRAYVFAYPSMLGAAAPLGSRFVAPDHPDTLYLHDLSVSPSASGRGLARLLVERIVDVAVERKLAHAALVSVQDSLAFWERLGFAAERSPSPALRASLATYFGNAVYMSRVLSR